MDWQIDGLVVLVGAHVLVVVALVAYLYLGTGQSARRRDLEPARNMKL